MAGRNIFSPYNLRGNLFGQYPESRSLRHRGMNSGSSGYQYGQYSSYYNDYICDDCHDRQYLMAGAQLQYYGPHDMICEDPSCSQFDIVMYDPGYGGHGGINGGIYGGGSHPHGSGNWFGRSARGLGEYSNKYGRGSLGRSRSPLGIGRQYPMGNSMALVRKRF